MEKESRRCHWLFLSLQGEVEQAQERKTSHTHTPTVVTHTYSRPSQRTGMSLHESEQWQKDHKAFVREGCKTVFGVTCKMLLGPAGARWGETCKSCGSFFAMMGSEPIINNTCYIFHMNPGLVLPGETWKLDTFHVLQNANSVIHLCMSSNSPILHHWMMARYTFNPHWIQNT